MIAKNLVVVSMQPFLPNGIQSIHKLFLMREEQPANVFSSSPVLKLEIGRHFKCDAAEYPIQQLFQIERGPSTHFASARLYVHQVVGIALTLHMGACLMRIVSRQEAPWRIDLSRQIIHSRFDLWE